MKNLNNLHLKLDNYFGTYAIGKPTTKEEAGRLLGADNIIGDIYKIVTDMKDGKHLARVVNRFGNTPCYFNNEFSKQLSLNEAKGFRNYAILTCVGFTQNEKEGEHWAEFAIISFPENEIRTWSVFVDEVSKEVKKDRRPEVDLSIEDVQTVIQNKGHFLPTSQHPKIEKKRGQIILKSRVKLTDMMIEQGRKKNPGCYIVGWMFLLGTVALIVLMIKNIFNL